MKLQPYPKYKDSGAPWLGNIPAHWTCLPHRAIFQETKNQGHAEEPLLSVTIKKGVIPQTELLAESAKKDASNLDKSKYKLVCKNDIAFNKMRAWQGAIGVSKHRGIVSPAYTVARLQGDNNSNYFHYLLRTPMFAKEAERRSYGIASDMWSLRSEDFKMIYSSVPSKEEQTKIARFLDWKTGQIDKFIRNKRRLIELLKAQKRGIVNQAVTRGLNPNVEFKPSGVEWIGDIPAHWNVRRLKFLCRNSSEQTAERRPEDVYIALENIEGWTGRLIFPEEEISFDSQVKRFMPGDILFGKLRPYLAKVARPVVAGVCVGDLLVLRAISNEVIAEYIEQKLRSAHVIDMINGSTFGAKMPRANWAFIGDMKIAYPPVDEQRQILKYIFDATTKIDQTIARAEREIALIREYRTRLIADVVTGQVDVRGIEVPGGG